jgi:hypothetical protein
VTLADATSGAAIYYTVDGSAPSAASTLYASPIMVSASTTINAIAIAAGNSNSAVASAAYTITVTLPVAATPTFSPLAGTYTSTQTVTINDATPNLTLYYTLDGSTPTTSSTTITAPITVAATETISVMAAASGFSNSAVATATYTITPPLPVISPTGTFNSATTVTITDAAAGASVYYTTNGSTPTTSSTLYTGPFPVSATETINAIAVSGTSTSAVATDTITIFVGSLTLNGKVLSGTTPVAGAQVQLYSVGQTGYGSAPTPVLSAPVATDTSGAFTFTYNCPTAPGDLVYLVASGGNPGAGANPSLQLMASVGSCGTAATTSNVVINEVTTVASAYALAQFAAPNASAPGISVGSTTSISGGLGNSGGLARAMKTVLNLMDPGTGMALSITPFYKALGGTSGGVLNSSYVPQARINTLANILNACVSSNGSSGSCASLFTAATAAGGTAPADTLQAILSIAQHQGSNAATLYGLSSSGAPFQPSLSSAPTDWTLALTFTGGGMGNDPANNNPGAVANVVGATLDASGNIWLQSANPCAVTIVLEFDNQGNGLSPAATAANTYCGGYQPQFNGVPVALSGGFAVDLNGNIWDGLAKMSSDGTVQQANYTFPGEGSCVVGSVAVDASNILWIGCGGASGAIAAISATDGSFIGSVQHYGPGNSNLIAPIGVISLDALGDVWGVVLAGGPNLYQINNASGQLVVTSDNSTSGSTFVNSVIADGVGNVFAPSATPGTITALAPDQKTVHSYTYPLPSGALGVNQLALDGAGNIWSASYSAAFDVDTTTPSYLVEMNSSGMILSPSAANVYGYTGTGGGGETQPILENAQFSLPAFSGIAVDGSGNIWIANNQVAFAGADVNPPGQQLVEFIGIAAPVVTPTSLALKNGQLGTRP